MTEAGTAATALRVEPDVFPLPPLPYVRLSSLYFFHLAALGAFAPYFGLYLDARGTSAFAISLVMSLWYGTRVFAPGVWSALTQRSPRPILWLRMGAIATLVCCAGFLLPLPLAGLMAVMAAYSFFANAVMPQVEALTLSHLMERATLYGRIRVWGSIGFVVTVAALGVLFDHVSVRWLPLVMLPILALVVAVAYRNEYGHAHVPGAQRESVLASLARPGVHAYIAAALLMQVAHGPYYVYFSLFLDEHGFRASAVGIFWTVGVLAEIVMFWFAARVLHRYGTASVLRLCLLVAAVRFMAIGVWPDSALVVGVSQLAHALGFGLFHATLMKRATELFPPHLMAQSQGLLYGVGSGVGGVLGALLAGLAWKLGGGEAAFFIGGAVALAGFLLLRKDRGAANTAAGAT